MLAFRDKNWDFSESVVGYFVIVNVDGQCGICFAIHASRNLASSLHSYLLTLYPVCKIRRRL